MPLQLDPEYLPIMTAMGEAMADVTPPARGDARGLREQVDGMIAMMGGTPDALVATRATDIALEVDGGEILLRWFEPAGRSRPGPAVLYIHGGGMVAGTVADYSSRIADYAQESGVPMLAVDYRLAPEHPDPTPVEDCYRALQFLHQQAEQLGVDPQRIAVMGDSAGGGLAAGLALLARDRGGPALSGEILIYPMLDDRTMDPDPEIAPYALWTYDANYTGWHSLLQGREGTEEVSVYAAPARAVDLSGLPPTYIEVGELDIFRAEDVAYASRLSAAGVPTELHVHPGVFHAFEALGPETDVARRSNADRIRQLRSI